MSRQHNTPRTANKRIVLLSLVAVLIVATAAIGVYLAKQRDTSQPSATNNTPTTAGNVNYSPPTKEEKQDSDSRKQDIVSQDTQANNPQTGTRQVTPIIVDANQYNSAIEVRSYVPGIIENGGKCTATFTLNGSSFSKESSASGDATTTLCNKIIVDGAQFSSKGRWSVVLSYSSITSAGSSAPTTFEVN